MAKFLNTSGANYYLEDLIKNAKDRLILISPFLRLNDRIKELLEDKNRLKIDVRIIYGKSELNPSELSWLEKLDYVRTSFCKNLHAKCYINEESCIITSLNLYEFSQVNNNEMGIFINRNDDMDLYREAYDEAQRIIRISEEVRMKVTKKEESTKEESTKEESTKEESTKEEIKEYKKEISNKTDAKKISSTKLAKMHNITKAKLDEYLIKHGFLIKNENGELIATKKAFDSGAELKNGNYGKYLAWPEDFSFKQ